MKVTDCAEADEAYALDRFAGGEEHSSRLIDHARQCPRPDFVHALPTVYWRIVTKDRERAERLAEWRAGLKEDEDGHRGSCSCATCYGMAEVTA